MAGRRCTGSRWSDATTRDDARWRAWGLSVRQAKTRLFELALRVVLQGLRRGDGDRGPDSLRPRRIGAAGGASRCRRWRGRRREIPTVRACVCGAARDGHVHVGGRLRHRRVRGAGGVGPAGLRHRRGGDAQLRRRRSGDAQLGVLMARGGYPEHSGLRAGLSGGEGRQAGAELPFDADHPRRGERGGCQQCFAQGQGVVDRRG